MSRPVKTTAEPQKQSAARRAPTATPAAGPRPLFVQRACKCSGGGSGSGAPCLRCEEKKLAQRMAAGPDTKPSAAHAAIPESGTGQHLSPEVRRFMEGRFRRDFGGVRVHTGASAAAAAEALDARAFTVGDDIVFNRGEYRPETRSGRHLLAHELAHTVQQAGLRRSAMAGAPSVGSEAALEGEANRVADAVVEGRAVDPISPVGHVRPLMAAKSSAAKGGETPAPRSDLWGWKTPPPALKDLVSGATDVFDDAQKGKAQAFEITAPFALPPEKGADALPLWEAKAQRGALETAWSRAAGKVGLYQARDSANLRPFWLEKVGWSQEEAPAKWHELRRKVEPATPASPPKEAEFVPRVAGGTCHMDHVVELQMQGTNVASNIAVLDGGHNTTSGSKISAYISEMARRIAAHAPAGVETFVLHFPRVAQPVSVEPGPCAKIEKLAMAKAATNVAAAVPAGKELYPLASGGATASVVVDKKKIGDEDIASSNASQLVPGLALKVLHRPKKDGHKVSASFDERGKTRIPLTLDKPAGIELDVVEGNVLRLSERANKNLRFHYPYLSSGTITKLQVGPEGVSGKGELVPSIPLLNKMKLGVVFAPDRLEIVGDIDTKHIQPPIPGFRVTQAQLSMLLHPEFKPSGTLAFVIEPRGRRVVEGALMVGADAQGFFARGDIRAFLPGVDEARGLLTYRKTGWEGSIHVEGSQFKLPLPGLTVKRGAVDVRLQKEGIAAEGRVLVGLPREQEAELGLEYARGRWLFRGTGTFKVPPLDGFTAAVTYDGKNLTALGRTSMRYRGFVAAVEVHYDNGKVHGKGSLDFQKGRVKGRADVEVDDGLHLSGKGLVTVRINDDLEATAGIELMKSGGVRLTGALTIVKPIVLFKAYGSVLNLFSLRKTIPIPGLSIGPLGVQAVLGCGLDAHYKIGPAALVGTTITLALDPFDDKPDAEVGLKSSLSLPASAGLAASITGGLELEAGLARAGGEVAVTGGAELAANAGADIDIKYRQKQLEVRGAALIEAGLVLTLGARATIYGEVGVWKFKSRWSKSWKLAEKTVDTGLKFKLKAPFSYSTATGAKLPTANEIEIVRPSLAVGEMVDKLVRSAGQAEKAG